MSKKMEDVIEEVKAETAPKAPKVEIIRGRIPVLVVAMIRYQRDPEKTKAAIAAQFRTTLGKVDDIIKGSNFAYIDETFKPTADQLTAAKEYIANCNDDSLTDLVDSYVVATEAEALGFEATRKATRKSRVKDADVDAEVLEDDDDGDFGDLTE